jgi:hypothetical protein
MLHNSLDNVVFTTTREEIEDRDYSESEYLNEFANHIGYDMQSRMEDTNDYIVSLL